MIRLTITAAALALAGSALAKLPPPDEAAKAKAAETAARSAWAGKVAAFQLCKVQDRIAARYKSNHPQVKAPAAAAATPAAPMPTPTPTTASQGGSTPVAAIAAPNAATAPPCADPGPFAYVPPEQKPLESSGAHSPAATATSPPSVRTESGTMTSGKTGEAPKK